MPAALQAWAEALNSKTKANFMKATRYKKQAPLAQSIAYSQFQNAWMCYKQLRVLMMLSSLT